MAAGGSDTTHASLGVSLTVYSSPKFGSHCSLLFASVLGSAFGFLQDRCESLQLQGEGQGSSSIEHNSLDGELDMGMPAQHRLRTTGLASAPFPLFCLKIRAFDVNSDSNAEHTGFSV